MARNAPGWKSQIDNSLDGIYKSLWAIPLTIPFAIIVATVLSITMQVPADQGPMADVPLLLQWLILTINLCLTWCANLFLLSVLAKKLQSEQNLAAIIIGYNWAQFLSELSGAFLLYIITLSHDITLISIGFIVYLGVNTYLSWGILRRGFQRNIYRTLTIFVMLGLISFIINVTISAILIALFR
ncbi:MAG: hypothetical protein ACWA5L_09915 [bacterium]